MKMRSDATPSPARTVSDQVHEGAGAADVEVGVEVGADEPGHVVGAEESGRRVVVVAHLEPAWVVRLQLRPEPSSKMTDDASRLA